MRYRVHFRCDRGHEQVLSYGPGFDRAYVDDHVALIIGGRLAAVGIEIPSKPCAVCGAPVAAVVEELEEERTPTFPAPPLRPLPTIPWEDEIDDDETSE